MSRKHVRTYRREVSPVSRPGSLPNRCEGCDKGFGDGPGLAKLPKGHTSTRGGVCANCQRWQYRHPDLTMADRRAALYGSSGGDVAAPLVSDRHWRQRAACRGSNPKYFDVNEDIPFYSDDHAYAAVAFCKACPVRNDCLADALANPDYSVGLRGGIYFPLSRATTSRVTKRRKPVDLIELAERRTKRQIKGRNSEQRARYNERRRKRRAAARTASMTQDSETGAA